MSSDYRLSLTPAERFILHRRRQGVNQRLYAKGLGLSLSAYSLLERGADVPDSIQVPTLGPLQPHERCLMYRRRAGTTQAEVAKGLEHCRYSVQMMESGRVDCTDLLAYWEN